MVRVCGPCDNIWVFYCIYLKAISQDIFIDWINNIFSEIIFSKLTITTPRDQWLDWMDWICLTTTHVLQDILAGTNGSTWQIMHEMSPCGCYYKMPSYLHRNSQIPIVEFSQSHWLLGFLMIHYFSFNIFQLDKVSGPIYWGRISSNHTNKKMLIHYNLIGIHYRSNWDSL